MELWPLIGWLTVVVTVVQGAPAIVGEVPGDVPDIVLAEVPASSEDIFRQESGDLSVKALIKQREEAVQTELKGIMELKDEQGVALAVEEEAVQEASNCDFLSDPGNCTDYVTVYFYNMEAGRCQTFQYGGCGGNSNKFFSEMECRMACDPRCHAHGTPSHHNEDHCPPGYTFDTAVGECKMVKCQAPEEEAPEPQEGESEFTAMNEENVEKESFVSEGEEIAQLEEEEREKIEKEFVEERIQVEVPAPGQH